MINILLVIGVILFVLWLLGLVSSFTLGGYLHIALVIAIILLIVWLISAVIRRQR